MSCRMSCRMSKPDEVSLKCYYHRWGDPLKMDTTLFSFHFSLFHCLKLSHFHSFSLSLFYLFYLTCMEQLEQLSITMIMSKGVISINRLVLGDSVLTISRDKGLIYTEVGIFICFPKLKNHVSSFLAGLIALQMQIPFSWRSPPTAPQSCSLATTSSSEAQWLTVPWSQCLPIKLRRGTSW